MPNVVFLHCRSKPLIILGEMSKLVPMSPCRVRSLTYDTADVSIVIVGKPGEVIDFYFIYGDLHQHTHCIITGSGRATISWSKQVCY